MTGQVAIAICPQFLWAMIEKLRVLELASVLAGPSVGQFFAELGAEVIKVENETTGGDITRTWKSAGEKTDDRSAYFCSVNWGKKSIAVDLTSPKGKAIIGALSRKADIVIASFKPGDAEKLGVGYAQIKAVNPLIIYGQISGYGPDNERVGYDAVLQAESGFMDMNGQADGPPVKMPVALIDVLAAHHLKQGILVALLKRQTSGQGALVEVSLLDAALASLANQATNWLVAGKTPKRHGSLHPNIAPYGEFFETADGKKILLAIGSDRQFWDLCALLHVVASDDFKLKFNSNQNRVTHRQSLAELLGDKFKQQTAATLLSAFHAKKIPAGLIQTVPEALAAAEAQPLILKHDTTGGLRNFVSYLNGYLPFGNLLPPPHFGEHTKEILEGVGGLKTD